MEQLAIGFWGAFFGTASLMMAGSIFAFVRSVRRVAINAAIAAAVSAVFVLAFLGAIPFDSPATLARVLSHVAVVVAAVLSYFLLSVLGRLRLLRNQHRALASLTAVVAAVIGAGWFLLPLQALALSSVVACLLGTLGLLLCLRNALRGDRLAWGAVAGVLCMLIALMSLCWIALDRGRVSWHVHAVGGIAGTAYLAIMAAVLWTRYAYLIELKEVRAHGPGYDTVTRMRSHSETSSMVGNAFKRYRMQSAPLGVIAVSLANLVVLEKLYGRAAVNHALFVCAARLRRTVPDHVEMGRLSTDGFLLLVRDSHDSGRLLELAHAVQAHLSRSVVLSTGLQTEAPASEQTRWVADVGVGILVVNQADARAATAVAMARGMSRTAWTFASRVAWYDDKSGEIVSMPPPAAAVRSRPSRA